MNLTSRVRLQMKSLLLLFFFLVFVFSHFSCWCLCVTNVSCKVCLVSLLLSHFSLTFVWLSFWINKQRWWKERQNALRLLSVLFLRKDWIRQRGYDVCCFTVIKRYHVNDLLVLLHFLDFLSSLVSRSLGHLVVVPQEDISHHSNLSDPLLDGSLVSLGWTSFSSLPVYLDLHLDYAIIFAILREI